MPLFNRLTNRRLLPAALVTFLVTVVTLTAGQTAIAQEPEPTPTPTPEIEEVGPATPVPTPDIDEILDDDTLTITMAELGEDPIELSAPSDVAQFSFDLPYRWIPRTNELFLDLDFTMLYAGTDADLTDEDNDVPFPALNVYANSRLVEAFTPLPGEGQQRIQLPTQIFNNPDNNRVTIRFEYIHPDWPNLGSSLIIQDTSLLTIAYEVGTPPLDLSAFPRPLVQDSFIPETVLVVVPANYTQADMDAAAAVISAIAGSTRSSVSVELRTTDDVNTADLQQSSAVFVGTPSDNESITTLYSRGLLPTTVNDDSTEVLVDGSGIGPEVGVIQVANSDVDPNHAYMVITGNTDAAVVKAARALDDADIRFGLEGSVALIEDLAEARAEGEAAREEAEAEEEAEAAEAGEPLPPRDLPPNSLVELGLFQTTFGDTGTRNISVFFFIPHDVTVLPGSTLDLQYINSTLLNGEASGINVRMNGDLIGSIPLDPDQPGLQTVSIPVPPSELRTGTYNNLNFEITLALDEESASLAPDLAWVRFLDTSSLNLDTQPIDPATEGLIYRNPLGHIGAEEEASVLFVLPSFPTATELQGFAQMVYQIGRSFSETDIELQVKLGEPVTSADLQLSHIVAIGQPSTNEFIAEINELLPQGFAEGTDRLSQTRGGVIYAVPEDFSIGLVEVIPSPEEPDRAITVVSGTTEEGLAWAVDAIGSGALNNVNGDIMYIYEFQGSPDLRVEVLQSVTLTETSLGATVDEVTPDEDVDLEEVGEAPEEDEEAQATEVPAVGIEVPQEYLPQPDTPSQVVTFAVYGMIGVGVLVGIAGLGLTVLRMRRQAATPDTTLEDGLGSGFAEDDTGTIDYTDDT